MKRENESFTDVILRLTEKKIKGTLLDYVRTLEPDEEFAKELEEIIEERKYIAFRNVKS